MVRMYSYHLIYHLGVLRFSATRGLFISGFRITSSNYTAQTFEESVVKFGSDQEFLFNPELLKDLDWTSVEHCFNPVITSEAPGETWLVVRPLKISDYDNGFLQILSQLTTVGNVSRENFEAQFHAMQRTGGYYVTVIEDSRSNKIIGSATLITELKFIHECGLRARLEDVVVNNTYRGKQLGKLNVLTVTLLAKKLGCYKMSLDCKDPLIPFYKTLGYKLESGNANSMMLRFEAPSQQITENPS